MKTALQLIIALAFLTLNSWAQKKQDNNVYPVNIVDRKAFVREAKPLIEKMAEKRIVSLGEGTHGTAEFYKIRYWITRELIEKKGFTHIAFENDLSDGILLNMELNDTVNLNALMKKRLLSIWQNEETKELLAWVRNYNQTHSKKVTIDGIDYVYLNIDLEALQKVLVNETAFLPIIAKLKAPASLQDATWEAMNIKDSKIDFNAMIKSSYKGYLIADSLDREINASNLSANLKLESHLIISNIKQAFAPFYHQITKTEEPSRDVNMALNVAAILKGTTDKMIIWAHNGHVAKTGIYDNAVGGMGGEIAKLFPNQYFVMGTGTANGTFAATEQSRDTYTNPMKAYPLEKTIDNSWETQFLALNQTAFYLFPTQYNSKNEVKPMRFIGYGPKSGPSTNDKTNIDSHFDAFLFISNSNAATPLK